MSNGRVEKNNIAMVSENTAERLKSQRCMKGDILFARRGDLGRCALIGETEDGYLNGTGCLRVRPDITKACPPFMVEYFSTQFIKNWLERNAVGQTMLNLNTEILSTIPVFVPPLPEQRTIIEILSTWDKAIEPTRRLIETKMRCKKALMQRLLTGKKRLAGFKEKWKEYPMGELFKERSETNYSHLPLLAITRNQGIIPASEIERKDSSNEDKSKYKRIVPGDIGYNTMRMWQGVSAVSTLEGIVSPAYTICIPKNRVDIDFMGYFLKFPMVINLLWRYSQGLVSDTLNLKYNNFSQIRVAIPPKKEQHRIAQVLSTADNEINQLEAKLKALGKQKRGLMQKLLTGEVRVNYETPH